MNLPVVWSERARRDFYATVSYLRERSTRAAGRWLADVIGRIGRLERFPESGRRVPELLDWPIPVRELVAGDYRIFYAVRRGRVEILTVFHGRRAFPPRLSPG